MTEQSGHHNPPSRGPNSKPGWYKVDRKINAEAYWDGQHWTKTRSWNGAAWVEAGAPPMVPSTGDMPGFGPSSSINASASAGPTTYAPPMMTQPVVNQRVMVQSTIQASQGIDDLYSACQAATGG